jgi:hypothetical protein
MASRHIWAAAVLLLAAVAWAVALFIEPAPWSESAAVVIASGLLVTVAVSIVAVMVDNSRMGYWLGVSGLGLMLVIAGLRRLDAFWVIAISFTALGALLMADRRLGGWIRMEGPVAPVPQRATALGLVLLGAPILTALFLANRSGGAIVWLALASWGFLLVYVRRLSGAVSLVRLGLPILIGGRAFLDMPGAAIWAALMVLASILAWSKAVRLAVRPLIERGSRVTIPPELLSDEIKRAAGIDQDRT